MTDQFTDSSLSWQLPDLCKRHTAWTKATFGPGRKPWNHLVLEAQELAAKPGDISEMADVMLLLIDTAKLAGFSICDVLQAANEKHEINKARQWSPIDDRGVAKHL